MSAGFTPGPWRLADNDESIVVTETLDADGNCTVVADMLTAQGKATPENLANARLIAAGPDLYEAARIAEQLANIASDWNLYEVEIDGEMRDIYDVRDIFRAALAKARGDAS